MPKRSQIFIVHGGNTFKNRAGYLHYLRHRKLSIEKKVRWTDDYLERQLGKKFQIIRPRMPLQDNAKYGEWKIHFERFFPQLKHGLILIGGSLGGIFLAKYLSEHKFPKRVQAVFLVCPPFDDTLPNEDLAGGFRLPANLSRLQKNAGNLFLLFSKNDDVVPVSHAVKYAVKLPLAKIIVYVHINGHFQLSRFPEIVRLIKKTVS